MAVAWLDGWIAWIRYVRARVECYAMPVSEILRRADRALLRRCGYRKETPCDSMAAFFSACERWDKEGEAVIAEFAGSFGDAYREEQLRACDYYLACLQRRREVLVGDLPRKKKLNATLCVCGTLGALILLW